MQKLKLIELNPGLELCKIFYKNCIDANKGGYSEILGFLEKFKKNIDNLTEKETVFINNKLFGKEFKLYNLQNEQGDLLLPIVYTSEQPLQNDNLVCFSKFGEDQQYDLIETNGQILYNNARDISLFANNIIFIQDQDLNQNLYQYDSVSSKLLLITELEKNKLYSEFTFSENRLFVDKGYYNENLEPITHFCFDNGKDFIEGLAAVSLNGKWGYINTYGEIVIDFQFGYASSFKNGQAEVLILDSKFQQPKGVWIEKECHSTSESLKLNFPRKHSIPLSSVRKKVLSASELIQQYCNFSLVVKNDNSLKAYGCLASINIEGKIISQEECHGQTSLNEHIINENNNINDWLEKITRDSNMINFIPDELYVNKQFIKQAIQVNLSTFYYLSEFYSDDEEICDVAFKIDSKFSYPLFSERLKEKYKDLFECETDEIELDTSNIALKDQEDDSDLPF